jgi:hypothetical protein
VPTGRSFLVVVIGFLVVLLASSGLEAMRFYSMKAACRWSRAG